MKLGDISVSYVEILRKAMLAIMTKIVSGLPGGQRLQKLSTLLTVRSSGR